MLTPCLALATNSISREIPGFLPSIFLDGFIRTRRLHRQRGSEFVGLSTSNFFSAFRSFCRECVRVDALLRAVRSSREELVYVVSTSYDTLNLVCIWVVLTLSHRDTRGLASALRLGHHPRGRVRFMVLSSSAAVSFRISPVHFWTAFGL